MASSYPRCEQLRDFTQTVAPLADANKCVEWWACSGANPYGHVWHLSKHRPASRLAFAFYHGIDIDSADMPAEVAHHCDNPPCINPFHLFGTDRDGNMKDMAKKGRGKSGGTKPPHHFGAKHPKTKLSVDDSLAIRENRRLYGTSGHLLAQWFGVSAPTIYAIINGKHWTVQAI